jgi:hypothetical protein
LKQAQTAPKKVSKSKHLDVAYKRRYYGKGSKEHHAFASVENSVTENDSSIHFASIEHFTACSKAVASPRQR